MSRPRRIIVLAANYQHFLIWCRDNHRSPKDPRVTYALDESRIRGYSNVDIAFYETWIRHPRYLDIAGVVDFLLATGNARIYQGDDSTVVEREKVAA